MQVQCSFFNNTAAYSVHICIKIVLWYGNTNSFSASWMIDHLFLINKQLYGIKMML